jgi:hypothetical protein
MLLWHQYLEVLRKELGPDAAAAAAACMSTERRKRTRKEREKNKHPSAPLPSCTLLLCSLKTSGSIGIACAVVLFDNRCAHTY